MNRVHRSSIFAVLSLLSAGGTLLASDPAGPSVLPTPGVGVARVSSVVALDGGCVFQDSLPVSAVENWDVSQGRTYLVTLTHVTDCANGGNDATIQVIVKNSTTGNTCLTAFRQAAGTYTFTFTMPPNGCHTYPIVYCTSGCDDNSGMLARRADGNDKASHLRAATFSAGCGNPTPDTDCTVPVPDCSAWVWDLQGGCGAPAPTLHSTMPINDSSVLISLKNAPAFAPLFMVANGTPFPQPAALVGGCVLQVDPLTGLLVGPFLTTAIGDFYLPLQLPPGLPQIGIRIQSAVVAPGGPLGTAQLTNGVELRTGSCSPFCTYGPGAFAGTGAGATVFDAHFETVFAGGLEIGDYDPSNGTSAPNGLRWTGNATGRLALEAFLTGAAGPSGAFAADDLNGAGTQGGGSLAIHTAALALNLGFNAAGVLGGFQTTLGSIVYLKMGTVDSLNGLTIAQILGVANQVLAGGALPAGYTHDSLAEFVAFLNVSFADCSMSVDASHRLYNLEGPQ